MASEPTTSDAPATEGFDSLEEALAALKDYLDADGVIEIHEDGCEGDDDCSCAYVTIPARQLIDGGSA